MDLIFCIFDTTVAMMLAWRLKHFTYTEISLLLGVRFSSTKFAQRKNLAKASWQKLFNLVVIRLKCWLWRVFHSVDPLTSKIWFVNLSSICFKSFVKCWREFGVKSRLHSHAMFSSFKEEVHFTSPYLSSDRICWDLFWVRSRTYTQTPPKLFSLKWIKF